MAHLSQPSHKNPPPERLSTLINWLRAQDGVSKGPQGEAQPPGQHPAQATKHTCSACIKDQLKNKFCFRILGSTPWPTCHSHRTRTPPERLSTLINWLRAQDGVSRAPQGEAQPPAQHPAQATKQTCSVCSKNH